MKEAQNDLPIAERVVVPLTSSVIRTQGESIQSSLYLKVTCDGAVVYADTSRVQLSPVDEWTDTDENRWWPPSFVLPRDPVVARIIDRSQRYLMAMADDPAAGSTAIRALTNRRRPPRIDTGRSICRCAPSGARCSTISSFTTSTPPLYSASNQRLRTPSDVVRGRRGTCIDFALPLSACLEDVDIYPVVFLLHRPRVPRLLAQRPAARWFHQVKDWPLPETAQPRRAARQPADDPAFPGCVCAEEFLEARSLIAEGKGRAARNGVAHHARGVQRRDRGGAAQPAAGE